jgi:hypothetical protein
MLRAKILMRGAEVNDLDLRNVSVREQQEDVGQNRDTDFLSRILKMMKREKRKEILDKLDKIE